MEIAVVIICFAVSLVVWKSGHWVENWYRLQTRLVLKFENHSDEFFKYANQVIEHPDASKAWVRRMAKLCVAVNDKKACKEFLAIFRSDTPLNDKRSAHFKSELDTLPQELREAILAATFHAVLAISYNSGLRGYLLRAQFADMFEKQNDKIKSTHIVMTGVKGFHPNHNDMVPA